MSASPVKLGFYDYRNNIFYEIESPEEYQRCLQYYQKVLKEEENGKSTHLDYDYLNDFDQVLGEFDQSHPNNQPEPQLQEYEF